MSYSDTIKLVQGDNLPGIQFTIRNKNEARAGQYLDQKDPNTWAFVDLTGASVTATIREVGGSILDTVLLVVVNAVEGAVLLSMSATTFQNTDGVYELEATVNFDTAGRQTVYDFLRLDVRERF